MDKTLTQTKEVKNFKTAKNSKESRKIPYPSGAIKFAELLFLAIACILLTAVLTGCNTTQTLAAQFGAAPLPTKVARKLYGTCGACDLSTDCVVCKATQTYNRKLAAAPAQQKAQYPVAGSTWMEHQAKINYQNAYQNAYQNNNQYNQYSQYNQSNQYRGY